MKKSVVWHICYFIIFSASFGLFSHSRYCALNSDNAVTVLMIHDFEWPRDAYFWGQDRMGSLIPLLAQPFHKTLGLPAIESESIIHYVILLVGFYALSSNFKGHIIKLIFCLFWFFPPTRFIDLTQFSFGIHYSFFGIIIWLLKKKPIAHSQYRQRFLFTTLIVFLSLVMIWVTDMALISAFALIVWLILRIIKSKGWHLRNFFNFELIAALGMGILGLIAIKWAKSQTGFEQTYSEFCNGEELLSLISIFLGTVIQLFTFDEREPITGFYAWGAVILILFISLKHNFKTCILNVDYKSLFFIEFFVMFLVITSSKWTLMNDVPRRYFCCSYVSLGIIILGIVDDFSRRNSQKMLSIFSLFLVLVGGFGNIYHLKYCWPKTLQPKVNDALEIASLGRCAIIGDYWNSYVLACGSPEIVVATPHDKSGSVKNMRLINEVLNAPKVFFVADNWLSEFPIEMSQFGHEFIRIGAPFEKGNCLICEYHIRNKNN